MDKDYHERNLSFHSQEHCKFIELRSIFDPGNSIHLDILNIYIFELKVGTNLNYCNYKRNYYIRIIIYNNLIKVKV